MPPMVLTVTAAHPSAPTQAASESFYAGALARIQRLMLIAAPVFTVASLWRFGWRIALGVACGCLIACINFWWLKRVVAAFAERITESGRQRSSAGIVARFVLRYLLMAAGAYVIFRFSPASVSGLFAGLFLPVAAIACEAAYEAYMAIARGV